MENSSKDTKSNWEGWYYLGVFISAILIFLGVWIYAMNDWGFLIGIMFGWIPALIAGIVGGFLWPILALGIIWMILSSN
jgi:hypothetical protein